MNKFKDILKKLIYPHWLITLLLVIISTVGLIFIFVNNLAEHFLAYILYVISAYTLTIIVFICIDKFPKWVKWIKTKIYNNKLGNKYMTDPQFRVKVSLYLSFIINMFYVIWEIVSGIIFKSYWLITIGSYYLILVILRSRLLRYSKKHNLGENELDEWHHARNNSVILLLLNIVLIGMVTLMIAQNKTYEYGGMLIYVMAAYTFYCLIMTIVDLVKYRKYKSPVMTTTKVVSLSASLISLLALETAMLEEFNDPLLNPYFKEIMIGATGMGIFIIIMTLCILVIRKSTIKIKESSSI